MKSEKYRKAGVFFNRSLAIRQLHLTPDRGDSSLSLLHRNLVYIDQRETEKAWEVSKRITKLASKLIRNNSRLSAREMGKLGWLERSIFLQNIGLALTIRKEDYNSVLEDRAFDSLQLGRKSSAAGAIARMSARFRSGDKEIASLIRDLQDVSRYYEKLDERLIKAIGEPTDKQNQTLLANLRKNLKTTASRIASLDEDIKEKFRSRYVVLTRRVILYPLPTPRTCWRTTRLW